jgi:hypothetical protein
MDPILTCPPGSELVGNYCVLTPSKSCLPGYNMVDSMCYEPTPSLGVPAPLTPGSVEDGPRMTIKGNCPTGYVFNQTDNICYPI